MHHRSGFHFNHSPDIDGSLKAALDVPVHHLLAVEEGDGPHDPGEFFLRIESLFSFFEPKGLPLLSASCGAPQMPVALNKGYPKWLAKACGSLAIGF